MSDSTKLPPLGKADDHKAGGGLSLRGGKIALERQRLEMQPDGWPVNDHPIGPVGGGEMTKRPLDVIVSGDAGKGDR